ncbi:MAG: 6-bladed beta-propeller [Bacteroidota bacterium]
MIRKVFIPVIMVLLLQTIFASCSKNIYKSTLSTTIFFPAPPDTARIQFLTSYNNSGDVRGAQSKFKSFIVGKEDPIFIEKPYGIAINDNKLFVVDPGIANLEVIDLDNNTFEYFIPEGRGMLQSPLNCNFDEEGNLYVADAGRSQVVVFDENLEYKGEISGDEKFDPSDVFIIGDTLFVTDPKNNRINLYNLYNGQPISYFPKEAKVGDENWLYNPLNLHLSNGKIYVTDFGDSRIKIYSMNGEYLSSVGSYGRGLGQFVRPKGIAVDRDRNLFAIDAGFQNVQIFNENGQLLMFFGGPYQGPGDMYLPANIIIDYDHNRYYEKFVDPAFNLKYLIFVTNQYGPDKVSVYGRIEPK